MTEFQQLVAAETGWREFFRHLFEGLARGDADAFALLGLGVVVLVLVLSVFRRRR